MKRQRTCKPKGFAAMKQKDVLRISRMGGLAVARIPGHMARLGRRGGKAKAKAQ